MEVVKLILIIIGSYFIGNISFARLFSKLKKSDIVKSGSGNPGTMNMLRTYGLAYGVLTLVSDVLKGAIPALVGLLLFDASGYGVIGLYAAGLSCILGHIYPVVYKFKGGKGIACTIGVFAVANPLWLTVFFIIAFFYLWFFDYGSIASLLVVSSLIIIEGLKYQADLVITLLLFAIFILTWFAHRANITRLLIGKENKANLQKSIKKKFAKSQIKTVKEEYKNEKSAILNEMKQEINDSKEELKKEMSDIKETYKQEENTDKSVIKDTISDKKEEFKQSKKETRQQFKNQIKDIKQDYISEKKSIEKNPLEALLKDIANQQMMVDDD